MNCSAEKMPCHIQNNCEPKHQISFNRQQPQITEAKPRMEKYRNPRNIPTPGRIEKEERFLTVSLYPEANPYTPWIRLRGLWLLQAGFTPKSRIRVKVTPGCLVITKE
jgi:hypothetical protein